MNVKGQRLLAGFQNLSLMVPCAVAQLLERASPLAPLQCRILHPPGIAGLVHELVFCRLVVPILFIMPAKGEAND
jgi:hypothetical protein